MATRRAWAWDSRVVSRGTAALYGRVAQQPIQPHSALDLLAGNERHMAARCDAAARSPSSGLPATLGWATDVEEIVSVSASRIEIFPHDRIDIRRPTISVAIQQMLRFWYIAEY